jgi:hypothetical protein
MVQTKSITHRMAAAALVLLAIVLSSCSSEAPAQQPLRLNELQLIGTHNSYHVQPPAAVLSALAALDFEFARSTQYSHLSLQEQLDTGIRHFELDVFADPLGGRFANWAVLGASGQSPASGIAELSEPGFKVLHALEVDVLSTCWTLRICLRAIDAWSLANPEHLPVTVFLEPKDTPTPDLLRLGFATPLRIGRSEIEALEAEVRSIFPPGRLLTPDDIRGGHATLEEAVLQDGWPKLDEARGKVLFVLLDEGEKRQAYRAGHPALEERAMFTLSRPGQPDAAIVRLDNPIGNEAQINELVRAGYLVRTRADADTVEARQGNTQRRDAAFASGAQFVSTDFPYDTGAFSNAYGVRFEGGAYARCNPLLPTPSCGNLLSPAAARR